MQLLPMASSPDGLISCWGVWFGLGQGLCRTPWPTVSFRLRADTTGLGESRLSGLKACRTVDRPRTPWWHTREGDAAVPVCVARAGPSCWGGGGGKF